MFGADTRNERNAPTAWRPQANGARGANQREHAHPGSFEGHPDDSWQSPANLKFDMHDDPRDPLGGLNEFSSPAFSNENFNCHNQAFSPQSHQVPKSDAQIEVIKQPIRQTPGKISTT